MEPNLQQLQSALDQTQGEGAHDAAAWKQLCLDRLDQMNIADLAADVAPFLEHSEEAAMLNTENLKSALDIPNYIKGVN